MYTRNTQFRFVITKLRHVRARARFQTRQLCFIPSFSFRFHSESAGIKRLSLYSAVDHFLSSRMVCMYFSYQHHICDPAALFRCAFRGPRDLSRKRGQKKENDRFFKDSVGNSCSGFLRGSFRWYTSQRHIALPSLLARFCKHV